jgi:hypothetical protein
MDSRAGGATEAEEAGAPTTAIQANLTHSGGDNDGEILTRGRRAEDRGGSRGTQAQTSSR